MASLVDRWVDLTVRTCRPTSGVFTVRGTDDSGYLLTWPLAVETMKLMWNVDWSSQALCTKTPPNELFVRGAEQNRAKSLCCACPVKSECLAEALDHQIEWGVWGGMTERERRALLRKRPNVTSWRRLLKTAMEDHTAVPTAAVATSAPA